MNIMLAKPYQVLNVAQCVQYLALRVEKAACADSGESNELRKWMGCLGEHEAYNFEN